MTKLIRQGRSYFTIVKLESYYCAYRSIWIILLGCCNVACNESWRTIRDMERRNDIFEVNIADYHIDQGTKWITATLHVTAKKDVYVLPSMSSMNTRLYLVRDNYIYALRTIMIIDPYVRIDDALAIGPDSGCVNINSVYTPGDGRNILYVITPLRTSTIDNLPTGNYRLWAHISICYTMKDPNTNMHPPPDILFAEWIVEGIESFKLE